LASFFAARLLFLGYITLDSTPTNQQGERKMKERRMRVLALVLAMGMFVTWQNQDRAEPAGDQGESVESATMEALVPTPADMSLSGILVKANVLDVSRSKRGPTENTWTDVNLSLTKVYRGKLTAGKKITVVLHGWLGSEKEKAKGFRGVLTKRSEIILPLERSWNPFLKRHGNYGLSGQWYYATPEHVREAETVARIPIGWTVRDKDIVSPWSAIRERYANADTGTSKLVCAKSGRPAYLTDPRLKMNVELVRNFRSDAKAAIFNINIKNPTKEPITVDSLRSRDGKVLWDESVLFVNHDHVWLPAEFRGFTDNTRATVIKPGQTLSGKMDWKAQYSFCTLVALGDMSFLVYLNTSRKFDYHIKRGNPKPPFQVKWEE
jgi:hypothetical protein